MNVDIIGYIMRDSDIVSTQGPKQCQELCHRSIGCIRFTWKKSPDDEKGVCTRISRVNEIKSDNSTRGIISGPAKFGGILYLGIVAAKLLINNIKMSRKIINHIMYHNCRLSRYQGENDNGKTKMLYNRWWPPSSVRKNFFVC